MRAGNPQIETGLQEDVVRMGDVFVGRDGEEGMSTGTTRRKVPIPMPVNEKSSSP